MAERHINLFKSFKEGDVAEWLQKFKICATANNWDEATQATKIPTLLDGVALMTYLEMSDDDKKDIGKIETALTKEFIPEEVRVHTLHEFESRKQLPGESPYAYLFRLKKLLEVALLQLNEETSETMLLQHFIAGLPKGIGQQLRAAPDIKSAHDAMLRAHLLLSFHEDTEQSAATTTDTSVIQRIDKLEEMMVRLLEDKSTNESSAAIHHNPLQRNRCLIQCFRCGRRGHMSYSCCMPKCNQCGRFGHVQDRCQGNSRGLVARGSNTNH